MLGRGLGSTYPSLHKVLAFPDQDQILSKKTFTYWAAGAIMRLKCNQSPLKSQKSCKFLNVDAYSLEFSTLSYLSEILNGRIRLILDKL